LAVRSVIVSPAQGRAPGCGRCGGLVVVESVFANRDGTGTVWLLVGRCVTCGCIDEPVIRANRLQTTAPDRRESYKRRNQKRWTEGERNLSENSGGLR
jgi:hypothetical protein